MLDRAGFARRARRSPATSTAAVDGADFVLVQIRVGGQAARLSRRDGAARLRLHRPGDDRRRRLREGAAHRAGRARDRRARARARRRRTPGSSTSRTRSGSSRARCSTRGHRAVGLCNVAIGFQRQFARAARRRAGAGRRRPGRAQPPDLGARGAASTARTCSRRCSPSTATSSPPRSSCRAGCSTSSASSPRTTCSYFYAHDEVLAEQLDGVPARGRRSPRSSASCSSCTATRR